MYKRNDATPQPIPAVVIDTNGAAVTSSVTCYVTKDNGSQAAGGGTTTHKGNGLWHYVPTQAETDCETLNVLFTGGVPTDRTVYPQTKVMADLNDLTALAVRQEMDANSTKLATLVTDTTSIKAHQPELVGGKVPCQVDAYGTGLSPAEALASYDPPTYNEFVSRTLAAAAYATSANQTTIIGYIDNEIADIKTVTDHLATALELDAGVYRFTVNALENAPTGTGGGGFLQSDRDTVTAIKAKTDNLPADPASNTQVLTRMATFTYTAPPAVTDIRAELDANSTKLAGINTNVAAIKVQTDKLPSDPARDSTVLTRAPADTALSNATWTNAKAAYLDSSIAAVGTSVQNVLTVVGTTGVVVADGSKTGYGLAATGLDAIPMTAPAGLATTFREAVVQLWRRFFKKATKTDGQLKTYADDGTTVVTTQTLSEVDGTETQGAAT